MFFSFIQRISVVLKKVKKMYPDFENKNYYHTLTPQFDILLL